MNQQTLSLEDRTLLLIDTLSEEASDFIERLNDDFTDYMSGEITDPHQDMLDAIDNSGFSPAEIQNIKDYIFLDNVRNSSERIATDFIAAYLDNRYNPDYTLENFLISWNSEDKIFLRGEDELGSYGPIIAGIFDMLERSNELSGHMYVFDDDYLEGIKGFKKLGIVSTSVNNSGILYELFLGTLGEETRQRVEDIIYDTRLANEAANKFLDEFPNYRNNRNFNLGNFLRYYDVEKREFNPRRKSSAGSYSSLYDRLRTRSRGDWENAFYEKLNEPVYSRVKTLVSQIGTKGITEEDKIRLVEDLAAGDLLQYVDMFANEGSDAEDILLAMNIGNVSRAELDVLTEVVTGGRESVKQYLGQCRFQLPDSAIQYDWRLSLMKISETVDPAKFEGDHVLSSILINKSIQLYADRFKQDKPGTMEAIRSDLDEADNPVYNQILQRTLAHYELRLKVGQVTGFRDRLIEVS
jgi:hypothetical protein